MHSLEELKSGKLVGSKSLYLACGLSQFPEEILTLADTLEILDLSGNDLHELPDSISQLKKLKILFISRNKFTVFPKILKQFPALTMIGFKSNQIEIVPENSFPTVLQWLILTDNKIKELPKSIGDCPLLQKCAIAGNQIQELPAEMANCRNLELLRVSANRLQVIPKWLFDLPKLSWIAFGGNPTSHKTTLSTDIQAYNWDEFNLKETLGEGASGLISKAHWAVQEEDVAIKIFKGSVTSDGLPKDEMAVSIAVGNHDNLIEILGEIKDHPEQKSGLIMKLISPTYTNLGNPPNLETCTRDVFEESSSYTFDDLLKIAKGIASVCAQNHSKGINHGDLYAHNILVNNEADCLLGDFGAATFYDVDSALAHNIERVEVRAFGCLIEDILSLVNIEYENEMRHNQWAKLIANCTLPDVKSRLSFSEILETLNSF